MSGRLIHRVMVRAVGVALLVLCAPTLAHGQSTAPWYRKSRVMDLTGAGPRDSIVLTATGSRPDQLAIAMTFYIGGVAVERHRWTSEDELYDTDSLKGAPAKQAAYLRNRLDAIVAMVKRQRIDLEQVKHMGDLDALRRISPRPTHQIMFSYAFETSVFFAWDPKRKRLVNFMECC